MLGDRVAAVEANLDRALSEATPPARTLPPDAPVDAAGLLTASEAVALFADMVRSRQVDVAARRLRADGVGYYTIASAGHEANVVLGALLRRTDPTFLHYRSGALMMARLRRGDPDADPVGDTLASLVAARDEPASGGRHKVWGSRATWVPPQTSTIASHLPKATGTAFALARARRAGAATEIPDDAVVCATFGDASVNHAAALAGINAARYTRRRGSPAPILLVCEDNGIGISVPTPQHWVADLVGGWRGVHYVRADGDLDAVHAAAAAAVERCRHARQPVFLHLPTVRLWGHAGSDVEAAYRTPTAIRADEAADPVVAAARRLVALGVAAPDALAALVADVRAEVRAAADAVVARPRLATRAEVMAPLAPHEPQRWADEGRRAASAEARRAHFAGDGLPEHAAAPSRRTLAAHLNAALHDELLARPEALVFGEDVAAKGGVYHVTAGLADAFGSARVFDTLLDETTILGVAQGAGLLGMLPIPEIQYLAYVHNALDQLRGEACSTSFFSAGRFTTPMVLRVASFAYQKGFGGHFHNDDAIGALRDIPGLVLAAPSRGDDAARMLRGLVAMARTSGRVTCLLEPIALYHAKDLHGPGDGGWLSTYPPPGAPPLLPGHVGVYDGGGRADLVIATYANGVPMSLRAAARIRAEHGVRARVVDLRWLAPLPLEVLRGHAEVCGRVLVADECRATGGGIADAVVAGLVEGGFTGTVASARSADSYVPLGPAADAVLLSEDEVVAAALDLAAR